MGLDSKTIKKTFTRAVVSGKTVELYTYERPLFYNWPPEARNQGTKGSAVLETTSNEKRRNDNVMKVRQTVRRLALCNANTESQMCKFVTYTFKDNVTNIRQANKEWGKYIRRLEKETNKKYKYLAVVEFQERGAIHYHVLYFDMDYKKSLGKYLASIWGLGMVNVKGVRDIRNVGAYIVKYMNKDVMDTRLCGEKAYFCSRGLRKPKEIKNGEKVAILVSKSIIDLQVCREYVSHAYGRINYQQGEITKITQ